eukprot:541366-Heterocapsa_arctica.AAC.1
MTAQAISAQVCKPSGRSYRGPGGRQDSAAARVAAITAGPAVNLVCAAALVAAVTAGPAVRPDRAGRRQA